MRDSRLSRAIPRIRRARGFRLYDMQGRRYLDLFRDGALLGHRSAGSVAVMKSVLSQGLSAALPSVWDARLAAALARSFPGHPEVRLYSSNDRALDAVGSFLDAGLTPGEISLQAADPALGGVSLGSVPVVLWRPFLPLPAGEARALLPQLPFRVGETPAAVCFAGEVPRGVPPSDTIPAFILAAALRGFAALAPGAGEQKCLLADPRVERALDAAPGWARSGPYVRAVFPEPEYHRVHAEFLRAGVLLFPGYPGPSVLPGNCSPGESRLLADLFSGIPGG